MDPRFYTWPHGYSLSSDRMPLNSLAVKRVLPHLCGPLVTLLTYLHKPVTRQPDASARIALVGGSQGSDRFVFQGQKVPALMWRRLSRGGCG